MKTSILETALFSLSLFQVSNALVGVSWSASNVPSTGLSDITFPISIANASHQSGYYFAQQYNFNGQSDSGYTGLQPCKNSGSASRLHAVFSSFIQGTTSDDSNCKTGADGGAGVSCAVDISATYAHTYLLQINNTQGTTWSGTLVDAATGVQTHIGAYTLPKGTKGITGSQMGFVEYYPWNAQPSHSCSSLPRTAVTFGKPFSDRGVGNIRKAYEYGDCVGKAGFQTQSTTKGVHVTIGF